MLDRTVFVRPIAHRGLHNPLLGLIENTAPAFAAAIARGYGIECDLQPLSDGTPVVFHDETLARLIDAPGRIDALTPAQASKLRYRDQETGIIGLGAFLDLVNGRVPLLIEIKSEWATPRPAFLKRIAALAVSYKGPLALMSFDPAVMAQIRQLAPAVPRGIVSGLYSGPGWWLEQLGTERAYRLSHLLENGPVAPDFVSFHVKALPTPVTRYIREVTGLPLFCWTVRTQEDRAQAAAWADAPTFEGYEP
jgi:glycerophosphoryl diester phosphodiesterase